LGGGRPATLSRALLRILNGEKPQDIPIIRSDNVFMFDWQALPALGSKKKPTFLPPVTFSTGSQLFGESFKWLRHRRLFSDIGRGSADFWIAR